MDFDGLCKVCVATPLRGFVEVVEPEPRPRVRHVTWWGGQTVRPRSQRSGPAVRRGQGASWAAGTPHPTKVMDPARHCQEPPPPPSPSCDARQGHRRQAAVPPAPQRTRTRLTPQPGMGGLVLEPGATCLLDPDDLRLCGRALTRLRFKVFQVYFILIFVYVLMSAHHHNCKFKLTTQKPKTPLLRTVGKLTSLAKKQSEL